MEGGHYGNCRDDKGYTFPGRSMLLFIQGPICLSFIHVIIVGVITEGALVHPHRTECILFCDKKQETSIARISGFAVKSRCVFLSIMGSELYKTLNACLGMIGSSVK